MKALKYILIAVVVLIAIPAITALFVQKDFSVERSIIIERPKEQVFDYLKHLRNQDNFSKWGQMDPNMKKTFSGTDATVGFISAWESQNPDVGKGEQEITAIIDGEKVDFELRFLEPWQATNFASLSTESVGDERTEVTWSFRGRMEYPMNLMLVATDFDKAIGDDFNQGLENLKKILEEQ
ncbi:MAG: polyketide cyclase [Flavobacteriales bacterium]|nr:polyketide cyclase [Flavobacteriales bacterium]